MTDCFVSSSATDVLTYGNYTIVPLYGQMTDDWRHKIIAFWAKNRAIGDSEEATRRTKEVVYVALDGTGALVAVTSAYLAELAADGKYYFYRMFLQPQDRDYGLMRFLTLRTRDLLGNIQAPDKPLGMIIVTENAKLMRKGMRRRFLENDFVYLGQSSNQLDVWQFRFPSGATNSGAPPAT